MGIRTVRLDESTETTLTRLRKATGLSISEVFKRGLKTYEQISMRDGVPTPWQIYQRIDLGKGGWSIAPANQAKRAVLAAIQRKHNR